MSRCEEDAVAAVALGVGGKINRMLAAINPLLSDLVRGG